MVDLDALLDSSDEENFIIMPPIQPILDEDDDDGIIKLAELSLLIYIIIQISGEFNNSNLYIYVYRSKYIIDITSSSGSDTENSSY